MSTLQRSSLMLGSKGNRLLLEALAPESVPTESDRELELRILWGDTEIDAQSFAVGSTIRIGSADDCDVPICGDEVWEGFELVTTEPGSSEAIVRVPPGAELHVYREGAERAFTHEARLALTDRCLLSLGPTDLILRWVRPEPRSKSGFFDATDLPFTKALSIVFLAQLTLWLGFWITPLTNERLSEELFKNPGGLSKVPPRTPVTVKPPTIAQFGTPPGTAPKDTEGKLGRPPTKKEAPQEPPKGAPVVDAQKRARDQQKIASSVMIRALSDVGPAFRSLFEGRGLGKKVNDALGGLRGGHTAVDFHGLGGTGSRGFGPGGGGSGVGIGLLPTKGQGAGPGGYGTIGFGGTEKKETKVTSGPSVVQGALSKDLIGNVIKKHWNEIKYCYETELNKDPQLNGKVSMSFTIDGTGAVSQADVAETTMNNRSVENCIVNRVRRWTFPEPKGGGEVIVTYPWIFRAAGSEAE